MTQALVDVAAEEPRLKALVADILAEAQRQGATAAEVAASDDNGLSLAVRLGELETLEFNRDRGFAVTVYIGQRKGSASTSDASSGAIRDTVAAACRIARYTAPDPCNGLAAPELMADASRLPDLALNHPWPLAVDQAQALALACEAAGRGVPGIINSEGASLSSHQRCQVYGNSHGFIGGFTSTRHSLSCVLIAADERGMQRDYWYSLARDPATLWAPEAIGAEAARRTLARLGSRRIRTGRYPVLFVPRMAAGLLGHLLAAISGGALYRRASFLLDSLGRQILPTSMSLEEQPLLPGAMGSAAFDADGVATYNKQFVADGLISSYVLGTYSARRLGLQTTANAGGVHNLELVGPRQSQAQLLQQMGRGLLVTELMGQGVNPVTGDYSRGMAGFWVEDGEIQHAVDELTIAGNLAEMYPGILGLGDDLDLSANIRTGSILLGEMTVAAG